MGWTEAAVRRLAHDRMRSHRLAVAGVLNERGWVRLARLEAAVAYLMGRFKRGKR